MATKTHPALGATAAGEAADQELVNLLTNRVQGKVLESLKNLEDAVPGVVEAAVMSAIVEVARVGDAPPQSAANEVQLSGHTTAIARPKAGGTCAAVWDTLDKMRADSGSVPTLDQVRKLAKKRKWNANNARIEFYRWRAFNGITRAAAKGKGAAPAQVKTATYTGPDRRAQRQEARA